MLVAVSLDKFNGLSKKSLIIRIIVTVSFLTFLLSFSPGYFLLVVCSLFLTLLWLLVTRKPWLKIGFLGIILAILFPISLAGSPVIS